MILKLIRYLLESYIYKKEVEKHINMSPYKNNLYSVEWITQHHDILMDALPDIWTHIENVDYLIFGLKLKILNVPWNTREDLTSILQYLESINLIHRKNEYQIVRNLDNPFNSAN